MKNPFCTKSGHFWSSFLFKLPTRPYPKLFFSYRDLLDASNKLKILTFGLVLLKKIEKNCKILIFLAFFSTFEAEARPSALKIFESRRTKVVYNYKRHLFWLQGKSIFAYFNFDPPYCIVYHIWYIITWPSNFFQNHFFKKVAF